MPLGVLERESGLQHTLLKHSSDAGWLEHHVTSDMFLFGTDDGPPYGKARGTRSLGELSRMQLSNGIALGSLELKSGLPLPIFEFSSARSSDTDTDSDRDNDSDSEDLSEEPACKTWHLPATSTKGIASPVSRGGSSRSPRETAANAALNRKIPVNPTAPTSAEAATQQQCAKSTRQEGDTRSPSNQLIPNLQARINSEVLLDHVKHGLGNTKQALGCMSLMLRACS